MAKNTDNKQINVTFDPITIWKVIAIVVISFLTLLFISRIIQPLILILLSFFLSLALNPTVSWIARRLPSKSRVKATGVAYIMVIGFLAAFFSFVFPPLVRQTIDFVRDVPQTVQELKDENTPVGSFIYKYQLNEEVDNITNDLGSKLSHISEPALATAGKVGSTIASVVVVLVLTFMMLVEGPLWIEKYFTSIKTKHRARHKELASKMYRIVVGFVNGQVFIAALGGVFASISLFIASQILDVQINAVALGGIIALFALLPLIGTIIGSIIVVLACLLVSFPLAVVMTIYFIVYQQIENVTIQPYVQSRSNTLTPLLVLISALVGVGIGGLLGAILAIPVAGCIKLLIDDYFERKKGLNHSEQSSV